MLRIFGTDIAELPLVATSNSQHGKVRNYWLSASLSRYDFLYLIESLCSEILIDLLCIVVTCGDDMVVLRYL
jgi:hypothetical protein